MEAGPFLRDAAEIRNLMVGTHANRPVYLRDVAKVEDGPEELQSYTRIGFTAAGQPTNGLVPVSYTHLTLPTIYSV